MTKKRTLQSVTNKIVIMVLTFFFLSGLTGLIYEILWTRMIVEIIGGAPFAVSIILTVFMGGLALGAFMAGRVIDRIAEPTKLVKIYGILELIIGGYGLAIPLLLKAYKPIQVILYNQLINHFMLYNILTFVGCSVLLIIPVTCMGATLPVLCRFYVTRLSHLGTHAGRLYGLNTIGAALGALLCGFWLINLLGVLGTLIIAVLVNGIIGLCCLLAGSDSSIKRKEEKQIPGSKKPKQKNRTEDAKAHLYPEALSGALVIFAVSGFCAMAYEVIWARLLGLIVGPTTYSFTIVLVTVILGLALGSMIFGRLADKTSRPIWLLISTQITAAFFVLLVSQFFGNSQLFFAKLIFNFKDDFALLNVSKVITLFGFMILPTLCLGAAFPLVGKIYTQSVSKVGRSIGFAYTINTIGAVLGSFCAGFLLIPLIGKENSLSLVIGLQLLTSLAMTGVILGKKRENIFRWAYPAATALVGLTLCFHFPLWNRHLFSQGKYHYFTEIKSTLESFGWWESIVKGPEILAGSEQGELVYYGDGVGGFTTVLKYPKPLGGFYFSMINSGKVDASSMGDMATQTLLAHFPMLFHRNPKTVMVLGLASGITAGEVLYYSMERLDVVDINQQVVAASDFFLPWNNGVLSNPKTNLIIQDGRAHLQLSKKNYDVIISEPSNPWMAGLATLYTREFFALAKDSLNEDGIFVQWIHSYRMDWTTFSLIGRTFAQVFPNSLLVSTGLVSDYLLVGIKGENKLTLDHAKQKLLNVQQSKNVTLSDPKVLYRLIVSEDLQKLFGHGTINTDNRPILEFAAPKMMYISDPMIRKKIESKKRVSPETANLIEQVTTNVDEQISYAAYALSIYNLFRDMVDLPKATQSQKERFLNLMATYCADNPIKYSIFSNDELKQRCRTIQIETIQNNIDQMPDKALSYFYLADLYRAKGMLDEALANYANSLRIKPDNADVRYKLAASLFTQGYLQQSIEEYRKVLRLRPNWIEPLNDLAWTLATIRNRELRSSTEALRLAKRSCKYSDYKNPNLLDTLAAAYAAEGSFSEAVATAEKALDLARSSGLEKLANDVRNRLRLYKAGRPYIETSPQI
jgi:spermidine synthase